MADDKALTNREAIIRVVAWQETYGPKIDEIHMCIFGNSEPEKGMATRLIIAENFIKALKKGFWIALGALITGGIGVALFSM